MNIAIKLVSACVVVIATFGTVAEAQVFPSRAVLSVTNGYTGADGEELRNFLQAQGFTVAKQKENDWHYGVSIYSSPSKTLRDHLGAHPACVELDCQWYWAVRNQTPPVFSLLFAHTYRFLWVENAGVVDVIFEDHSLWRGNK
ncbi:MAG: hypothetical protein MK208_17190 [Shimia sp.]|uniref:hypothetical protein n=1 Tax=Shimia sp. TaxID=1954381 RepID=UPI0025D698C5|nr:hypothetical protein [Shimia sp.]MCH2068975.1 hypothetical protein [Shimia sp.]